MQENKEIISADETNSQSIDELLKTENYVTPLVDIVEMQDDFILKKDPLLPNCIHLLGMESPALTASLAIGNYVTRLIK